MGAPTVPLPTTRTEWSSYPSGVDGGADDAGDVDVDDDIVDSGYQEYRGCGATTRPSMAEHRRARVPGAVWASAAMWTDVGKK